MWSEMVYIRYNEDGTLKGGKELPQKSKKWSCYDCLHASDKCKNNDSDQYDKFLQDIERCSLTGLTDNSLGCSWRKITEDL